MAGSATRQTLTGAFVLGSSILALAALVFFGNASLFSRSVKAVIVFQDSISGLSIGAPVTFRGVRVGEVTKISLRFDPIQKRAYIPVQVSLDPNQVHVINTNGQSGEIKLNSLIAHGLRAEQNLQSFVTGQTNINLNFFPGSPDILHPQVVQNEVEIPTHASAIQQLKETLQAIPLKQLAANANETLISIHDLAQKLDEDIPVLVKSTLASVDESRKTFAETSAAISNLQQHLDVTLSHIDTLMTTGNDEIKQRGSQLQLLLASAVKTSDEAYKSLHDAQSILSPRSNDRANLDATLRDIAAAAGALRGFATDVERNPQLLLTGRRQ
ncbi:MAG: MlaD family protein [Acetobacter sp.]|jgi:paraquat-inducible protein B|nr:MlaD family protein [Acetobacter sp.]MCH4060037.1 MlaD family protein [Acetobacter sp.]MCH4086977.1 MlaD family protein [Acetobacter sp.]MCI1294997.1 MlaD family protein [Acetobacter sp.]MCI1321587.1 MlaD family protein [Acetobacter sp.]